MHRRQIFLLVVVFGLGIAALTTIVVLQQEKLAHDMATRENVLLSAPRANMFPLAVMPKKMGRTGSYPIRSFSKDCTIECFRDTIADFLDFYEKHPVENGDFGNRYPIYPLVSGDGFRYHAYYTCDETKCDFNPLSIDQPIVIFVKTDEEYLVKFFEQKALQLRHPYIVITHNGDNSPDSKLYQYLKHDLLQYWAGTNLKIPDNLPQDILELCNNKLISIPIGLTNRYNPLGNPQPLISVMKNHNRKKDKLVLSAFSTGTNSGERKPIQDMFANQNWVSKPAKPATLDDFYQLLADHKFFLSPFGNGIDCHRTWEGLYLGSIPIIRRVKEHRIWETLFDGLPVLFVDKWSDVTEELLNNKYKEFEQRNYVWDKLFMTYWVTRLSIHPQ